MSRIHVRSLRPSDAAAYQRLRLGALQESPTAFISSYDEEKDRPLEVIAERLHATPDSWMLGAFAEAENGARRLEGVLGMDRETRARTRHKAALRSMYVRPEARGHGIGGRLLDEMLRDARALPGLRQVLLTVVADNEPARRLYHSRGFVTFGLERGALCYDGVFHDLEYMQLTLREDGS